MVNFSAGCWYSIFLDAYTYSTNYLIFTITVIITSIVLLWVYEKPKFYKVNPLMGKELKAVKYPVPYAGVTRRQNILEGQGHLNIGQFASDSDGARHKQNKWDVHCPAFCTALPSRSHKSSHKTVKRERWWRQQTALKK